MKLNEAKNLQNDISGIYMIVCVSNNVKYVGSSSNIKRRIKLHLTSLRKNKHHNEILQGCFNQFHEENFIF